MAHIAISQIFAEPMIRGKSITGQNDNNNNNILVCEVIIYLETLKTEQNRSLGEKLGSKI